MAPRPDESTGSTALEGLVGYLNFSSGKSDPAFLQALNDLWFSLESDDPVSKMESELLRAIDELEGTAPAFADCSQARAVVPLAFAETLPAYRQFHADLLHHLKDRDYEAPFFLGRVCEAVLAQSPPWEERDRIVDGAVRTLNDFIGYRPTAVLENDRKMEPYPHERFRPVPLYIAGAGVAAGRYASLIDKTVELLKSVPSDLLENAHFHFDHLDELALDSRAYDHLHPVFKRTNYVFGEWDPHLIDVKGNYRRFVVRKIVCDSLAEWVESSADDEREERLFDAAAAMAGTILMASAVSGYGPETHDSSVTLTSLLPVIARRRDEFYQRLLTSVGGGRKRRLEAEAERTQQPFGHIRQFLNMRLAGRGARQVQHRELAALFARLGDVEASRQHARAIPCPSIRFESEIQCCIATCSVLLDRGEVEQAAAAVLEIRELLERGIACGAIVDPWNILGFAAHFPLSASREDVIPDGRVESLLYYMEQTFDALTRTIGEAAAAGGLAETRERLIREHRSLADWWDQFGSSVIEDLPEVNGEQSVESAVRVSDVLTRWREGGEATGDVRFWQEHVSEMASAQSYGQVVTTLLDKNDWFSARALLMQWLSQADQAGLESSQHSLLSLLIRWFKVMTSGPDAQPPGLNRSQELRRFFNFLEANADEYWTVPTLSAGTETPLDLDDRPQDPASDEVPSSEDLFSAAYEQVVYRDSTDDGNWSDTLDAGGDGFFDSELELLQKELLPRLKFVNAIGQLWQLTSVSLLADAQEAGLESDTPWPDEWDDIAQAVGEWREQSRRWRSDLHRLLDELWHYEVQGTGGDHDANVEYDAQLQTKVFLLHQVIATIISLQLAERMLGCMRPATGENPEPEDQQLITDIYRSIMQRDVDATRKQLPKLLKTLSSEPLLYVPLDNGGTPLQMLRVQSTQSVVRFLLRETPRLGLFPETWRVLRAAHRMERNRRFSGPAITEFDRLFDLAVRNTLESVLHSATHWRSGKYSEEELAEIFGEIIEHYQIDWMRHSKTMRLSAVDSLHQENEWRKLKDFIAEYGDELFHASQLTLGHLRAILHQGIDWFLDVLAETQDAINPLKLLDDLESGAISRDTAQWCLEQIYTIVVDRFDRFIEYNTTTTQSDYGGMLHTFLDFLRIEARYDRDAWNLTPIFTAHEVLVRFGHFEAARVWEDVCVEKTREQAETHIQRLHKLQARYGMQMPAVADHLNERLIKPLAVNRMVALVGLALREPAGEEAAAYRRQLQQEVEDYLEDSWGSGVDVPEWLRQLHAEVMDIQLDDEGGRPGEEAELLLQPRRIGLREMNAALRRWREPLTPRRPRRSSRRRPRNRRDENED